MLPTLTVLAGTGKFPSFKRLNFAHPKNAIATHAHLSVQELKSSKVRKFLMFSSAYYGAKSIMHNMTGYEART